MLYPLMLIMIFISVCLLVVALLWPREEAVRERIRSLGRYRRQHDPSDLARPFADRVLLPTLTGLSSLVSGVLPSRILERVRQMLVMAGNTTTLNTFLIQWALLTLVPPALVLILSLSSGPAFGAIQFLMLLGLAAAGAALPILRLNMRARRRQKIIWKSLPDAFDLITTCVEAGLGVDAALSRVAEKVPGPFARELHIVLREMAMGKSRREALLDLIARTGVDDLSSFVNAVVQAEQMGVSIATVLRVQSEQLRIRRKQRAEQAGRRAAVLIIFPVVLCSLPSLFVVAVGPAALQLMKTLNQ